MTQIGAYLHFDGNCREAMTFYKESLGGELAIQLVGETPMADHLPPEKYKSVLHSSLTKDGFILYASDMMEPDDFKKGKTISLCIDCSSQQEITTFFTNLSAGAVIGHALKEEFWGATFGELTDRFGINWIFNFDKNKHGQE